MKRQYSVVGSFSDSLSRFHTHNATISATWLKRGVYPSAIQLRSYITFNWNTLTPFNNIASRANNSERQFQLREILHFNLGDRCWSGFISVLRLFGRKQPHKFLNCYCEICIKLAGLITVQKCTERIEVYRVILFRIHIIIPVDRLPTRLRHFWSSPSAIGWPRSSRLPTCETCFVRRTFICIRRPFELELTSCSP